jgi:hypothetical protein
MEVLMRFFALLMILSFLLRAEDLVLLNTHIKMIPKIMALDTQFLSKNSSNQAILGIIYADNHRAKAKAIADDMNQYYNGKVANIPFVAIAISVDELMGRRDVAFVYVTQMSEASTARIGAWGISNGIPTFAYDTSALEYGGILGSIAIERNTVIYISKSALKTGKFHLNNTLLQIARLIE